MLPEAFQNISLITQYADCPLEAFRIVLPQQKRASSTSIIEYKIEKNCLLRELLVTIRYALFGGRDEFLSKLKSTVDRDVQFINSSSNLFVEGPHNAYTDFFYISQKYNHLCAKYKKPLSSSGASVFYELHQNNLIASSQYPQLAPLKIDYENISQNRLREIPKQQDIYTQEAGTSHPFKTYYYSSVDSKVPHRAEGFRIVFSTQKERLFSFIGSCIEKIANLFGIQIKAFKKYHYFIHDEDKNQDIYAKDSPLVADCKKSTSYWIGHASCLLSIPFEAKSGRCIPITMITDPTEGSPNRVFYPRITRPGRATNDLPLGSIHLSTHNHLDHFEKSTIQKLRKFQPIVLTPEGDGNKFRLLGFTHVHEMLWWQTITIPIEYQEESIQVKITAVPAKHWSGQKLTDAHASAFLGYVIHKNSGDIYFAGDTARLSQEHIQSLKEQCNITVMFQPAGPDEVREDMERTHQSTADGLWMHFCLLVQNLYDRNRFSSRSKKDFLQEAKNLRTIYMHMKTYKLGNVHFDDAEASIFRIKEALLSQDSLHRLKHYEKRVYEELIEIGKSLVFSGCDYVNSQDILYILNEGVIVPKIGSRLDLNA